MSYPMLLVLSLCAVLSTAQEKIPLDKYGGAIHLNGKKTGFFHIQNLNNRTFLMSPEGHAFFALGLNHISNCEQEIYHHIGAFQKKETRLKKIRDDLSSWQMNNCGNGCPKDLQDQMPFFLTLSLLSNGHYKAVDEFTFDDIFDPNFVLRCKNKIRTTCTQYADNNYLIGYYFTDTPRWDILTSRRRHGDNWVSHLRNQNGRSAGKKKYVDFLRARYQDISLFNAAYGLHFRHFDQLYESRFDHIDIDQRHILADDQAFLGIIAEQLYALISAEIKRYDPNHLLFGDKHIAGDHPEAVLRAAANYVDVISIQPGPTKGPGPGPGVDEQLFDEILFDNVHRISHKPIIICDHQTSFYTEEYPVTLWHQFRSQKESGEAYERYLQACAAKPYVIGYERCQYIDFYDHHRGLLKQGLLNQQGALYPIISDWTAQANFSVLHALYQRP